MKRCILSHTTLFVVASLLGATAHASGDAARGADIFRQNCSSCHSQQPGKNLVGPTLFSVVGRPAASIADFPYSAAMKSSGIVWTTDHLVAFLKAPRKYLPGVKMMFPGLADEQDRENVVAFLATRGAAAGGANGAASQLHSFETQLGSSKP
jgi:cytochrome c2